MYKAATRLRSYPKLVVASVANAGVRVRAAYERLRREEIPMAWHSAGYPNRNAMATAMLGMIIERDYFG